MAHLCLLLYVLFLFIELHIHREDKSGSLVLLGYKINASIELHYDLLGDI